MAGSASLTKCVSLASALFLTGFVAVSPARAQGAAIPDFSTNVGWQGIGNDLNAPTEGPGPVTSDPLHPYVSNAEAQRTGKQPNFRVADLSNPVLLPWTREALRKQNEEALSGKVVFTRESRCWPTGVPAFLLNPALPIYFLQTATDVWIVLEPDHRVRRVALNQPHSANPVPSWYGESVGHYEGDTLVVDTIGFNDRSHVDNYRTPHTTLLRVVERYRMIDGGRRLEVHIRVEDPGAFTMPWAAIRRFNRVENRPMEEVACAENNGDYFNFEIEPLPIDETPDF